MGAGDGRTRSDVPARVTKVGGGSLVVELAGGVWVRLRWRPEVGVAGKGAAGKAQLCVEMTAPRREKERD